MRLNSHFLTGSAPQSLTAQPELSSPFLDEKLNNTRILVTSGERLTLNCRVDRHQVSSVQISKKLLNS